VARAQLDRIRSGIGAATQYADQLLAIRLHITKKLVVMFGAIRQYQCRVAEAIGFDRGAVSVQVIAIGNLPAHLDAVACAGLGRQYKHLIHRRQFASDRGGGRQCGQ